MRNEVIADIAHARRLAWLATLAMRAGRGETLAPAHMTILANMPEALATFLADVLESASRDTPPGVCPRKAAPPCQEDFSEPKADSLDNIPPKRESVETFFSENNSPSDVPADEVPPAVGFDRKFLGTDFFIRCTAQGRPGLPPIFTLFRTRWSAKESLVHGNWPSVLKTAKKLMGDILPPFKDNATEPDFPSDPHPDQLPDRHIAKPKIIFRDRRGRRHRERF